MSNLKFKFNIYKIREWADDIFFEIHNLLALTRFIYYFIKWHIRNDFTICFLYFNLVTNDAGVSAALARLSVSSISRLRWRSALR